MAKKKALPPVGPAMKQRDLMRNSDAPLFPPKNPAAGPALPPALAAAIAAKAAAPKPSFPPPSPVQQGPTPAMHEGGLVQHPDELEEMTKNPEAEELPDTESQGQGGAEHAMHKALAAHHAALAAHYSGLVGDQEPGQEEEYGRMMEPHTKFDELSKLTAKPTEEV